jgi:hypothetical protein
MLYALHVCICHAARDSDSWSESAASAASSLQAEYPRSIGSDERSARRRPCCAGVRPHGEGGDRGGIVGSCLVEGRRERRSKGRLDSLGPVW